MHESEEPKGSDRKRPFWTSQELDVLREMYPSDKFILEEIELKLPAHSRNAISCKASELGLRRPLLEVPEDLQKPSPSLELDMSKRLLTGVVINPLYSIVKAIQLMITCVGTNPPLVMSDIQQLLTGIDINPQLWKELGHILTNDDIRRATFYLNLEGAVTQRTLVQALNLEDRTAWRIINHLKTLKIAFPSMKISRPTRSKGGPPVTIYQTPDATPEQIQHAATLHKKLESPQYLAAVNLAQTILNDYPTALDAKEISIKDLRQYARGLGYRDPGIIDLAAHQLQEQGIKVWR